MNLGRYFKVAMVGLLLCGATTLVAQEPLFTTAIQHDSQGELVMTQKGTSSLDVYSKNELKLLRSFAMDQVPTGVVVSGGKAYVTTFADGVGHIQVVSLADGKVLSKTRLGSGSCAPMFSDDKTKLYVCNQFSNNVVEIDVSTMQVTRTVNVLREPKSALISKDGRYMYVPNFLPAQRADLDVVAAAVSVIDMSTFKKVKDIQLANGSNALRDICMTPDGRYIYVTHNLGRFTVPTSQLQQGWMNTSAFSIIDTQVQDYVGVVLVDEPDKGAAGVWSIACNEDQIFVSHSGTHEISVIDHKAMLERFAKYPDKSTMDYDLRFLYGLRKRIRLEGNGPRDILLDGDKLYVPTYFADILNVMDATTLAVDATNLNPDRVESNVDKGEKYFNDAENCFQTWQSCNGCHPGDGRTDGMNWDLMNDGVGNSKNCKSMLLSYATPPAMISGIRASSKVAVGTGFKYIQFYEASQDMIDCVFEYMSSLTPVPSPYLVDGELSEKAKRGREVYEELKCDDCHSGAYYTDMQMYSIGADVEFENGWDTPTLVEVWRTAPYLFDGRAATLKEVFSVHKHGIEKRVKDKDIEALTEYVNSL